MEWLMKALILWPLSTWRFFTVREGMRIYRRYQAKKDLEAFAEWAKKRLEERQEEKKERRGNRWNYDLINKTW